MTQTETPNSKLGNSILVAAVIVALVYIATAYLDLFGLIHPFGGGGN